MSPVARNNQLLTLLVVLSIGAPVGSGAREPEREPARGPGVVVYVLAERLFIDRGSDDGIVPEMLLDIRSAGVSIAEAVVVSVAPQSAAARFSTRTKTPRAGDTVVVRHAIGGPSPVPPAEAHGERMAAPVVPARSLPLVTAVDEQSWHTVVADGYSLVPFAGGARTDSAAAAVRAAIRLGATAWVSFDASGGGTFERQQLDLTFAGPLDREGRFVLDADLSLVGQLLGSQAGRPRAGRAVWLDVYRAALWFRGIDGLGLGLGRLPGRALRYGMLDGLHIDLPVAGGPTVTLALGLRPDSVSWLPAFNRPQVAVGLSGDLPFEWGGARYGAAVSWLGSGGTSSDGIEASADLGLDLAQRAWVGLDLAGIVVAPHPATPSAGTEFFADRIALTSTVHLGPETLLHVAARRLVDSGLGTDRALLPLDYLPGDTTYDALAAFDSPLAALGDAALDLRVSAGGVSDPQGVYGMVWASPGLLMRAPGAMRLHGRLAYRFEYGWVTSHLGELGASLRPLDGLSIDLMHQGGVLLTNDRHQLFVTQTTWLTVGYRLLDGFDLALRGRGIYGQAGNGVEASLFVSGRDFW